MAKPIRVTIKGAGEAGDNAPTVDDLLGQVRDLVELLQGVEKAVSDDHTNQIVWRVTDAERKNPISFELTPFPTNPAIFIGARAEAVERVAIEGLVALRNGETRPAFFTDEVLSRARKLHARVKNGLADTVLSFDDDLGGAVMIDTHAALSIEKAFELAAAAGPVPYREIGSIEGFVSRAELDGYGRAVLRFRARIDGTEIKAVATGSAFQQLESMRLSEVWHGVRVRVYGTISYKGLGVVESVVATGIEVLDRTDLPGIDAIVDPNFTGGLSADEFLAEQRRDH